jgi:NAD(P)-dependent dehydrogenase (short-subunit alcohol dehydrogenase family)
MSMDDAKVSDRLDGKIVVVTGGASGIGAAAVRLLLDRGALPVALDLAYPERVGMVPGSRFVACDVTQSEMLKGAFEEVAGEFGKIHGVVASAGINGTQAPLESLRPDEWRATLGVCLDGVFYTIRAAIPHMLAGGSIVVVSSITGTRSFATEGAAAYAAAKAGSAALAHVAAVELGRFGVRVNTIAPGAVPDTRLWDERTALRDLDSLEHRRLIDAPLRGEVTNPLDVAELAVFLLSERARRISGALVHIDGAQSLLGGGILKTSRIEPMPTPKGPSYLGPSA